MIKVHVATGIMVEFPTATASTWESNIGHRGAWQVKAGQKVLATFPEDRIIFIDETEAP